MTPDQIAIQTTIVQTTATNVLLHALSTGVDADLAAIIRRELKYRGVECPSSSSS